ncbi:MULTISPECIES: GbsR/MarR family transcriptional regulator [Microbacterium]|jgi:DNA-binding transcriptional regulator GbsR (MarR family)|uniref:GbsR/MarR family transcriptional regulator n=1 Tax=Microbacterium TaxID=33882 RepID=UPI001D17B8C0|nr:transcriptional regulator [Microbacterium testaceum]MCC4250593.1 transcriptional regulator [Microbacterium testaceum]
MTADADFINAVGDLMASWSLSRATGRVYGALLLEEDPVSLDHLADRVSLSKGQISTSTRELISWGLARSLPQPGSRRILIEAAGGLDSLLASSQQRTRALVSALEAGRGLVREGSAAQQRLGDVIDLFHGYVAASEQILLHRRPPLRES